MSVFSKTYSIRHLMAAALLLPLLCACSLMSEDYDGCDKPEPPLMATANHYINLNIVVSTGNENVTRATPAGGEDGDGREEGLPRENNVNGITFMLYEVSDGEDINNLADDKRLAFIKYFPVELKEETAKDIEAVYTTGPQSLENSGINLNSKYHALVVANLDLTQEGFDVGSKVKDVLEHTSASNPQLIYNGSSVGATAKDFVMSSEKDFPVDFKHPQRTETTPTINGAEVTYVFESITIERLAARVDFWTDKEYVETSAGNGYYSGYKYNVVDQNGNKNGEFVLTAITPFNFYRSNEYIIKRIGDERSYSYLAQESDSYKTDYTNGISRYVIDPKTFNKGETGLPESETPKYYNYPLKDLVEKDLSGIMDLNSDFQAVTIRSVEEPKNQWNNAKLTQSDGSKIIIIGYPKENTLPMNASLYDYATGLRIEGDYYKDGFDQDKDPDSHLVYYGFLRHEGEGTGSYEVYTKEKLIEEKEKLYSQFPMNFGVVRNNIYRISIDKITQTTEDEQPKITWQIKVKKWDEFKHGTIYM